MARFTSFALLALVLALPLGLVGCGGEEDIRELYDAFRAAYEAGDQQAMLELLTPNSVERLGADAASALQTSLDEKYHVVFDIPLEELEPLMTFNREARTQTPEGEEIQAGKLIFQLQDGTRYQIPAVCENEEWRFDWPRE